MDAYQTLGVSRDASPEDIKRAYRKLAAQHHPDKGGDTAKFQEIQSAYETLTDPQKRQQHDNPFQGGPNGSHFEFHFGGGGPEDIFQRFFQQGFANNPFGQRQQQRRNKDLRISINVTLASTLEDQNKTVSVQTTKGERFNVDVHIPRGIDSGATIKYTQMGDNFFDTLPRGDLYIVINVIKHENYEVYGVNLVTRLEIDAIDAMLGVDKELTTIDNKTFSIKIPAGCQYGTRLSLSGQGLYKMNTNYRGDLIIELIVVVPQLSEQQLSLLKNLKVSL